MMIKSAGRKRLEAPETKQRFIVFWQLWSDFIIRKQGGSAEEAAEDLITFTSHLIAHIAMGSEPTKDFEKLWRQQDAFIASNQKFVRHYIGAVRVHKTNDETIKAVLAKPGPLPEPLDIKPGMSRQAIMLALYLSMDGRILPRRSITEHNYHR